MSADPSLRPLRLLIVATYPPPFGGIATHLTTLIPGLKQRGVGDVAVLSFSEKEGTETKDGFVVYRRNIKQHVRRLASPRSWPLVGRAAATLVPHGFPPTLLAKEALKAILVDEVARKHDSNVVSFYQADMSIELLPLALAWGPRRRIVLSVFGEIYENVSRKLILDHRSYFRRVLEVPAAVVSSSRHCSRAFEQIGVTRNIDPVYYGVDLKGVPSPALRASFRNKHGIRDDEVVVLFMARFSKEMGLDVVIRAAPRILRENPSARLILAGASGDQTQQAKDLAAKDSHRVMVMQDVPFAEQPALYSGADLLVAPSFNQRACMGMAIKEAMASALPVIGGAGGGVPEAIVDGETGYLVPVDATGAVDVAMFAERVALLVSDAALRKRLGSAGRRRAEDLFAYERTNDRMADVFLSALR